MKLFIFIFTICLGCFSSLKAQDTINLDSLKATLKNLSWQQLDSVGRDLKNKQHLEEAEIYLQKAVEVAENKNGKDSTYAVSCTELGAVFSSQGNYEQAESFLIESKEVREKIFGTQHPDYASSCSKLAVLYRRKGEYQKSENLYIEAKNIQEQLFGKQHPDYAYVCNQLGSLYRYKGLYDKAEPLYLEAKNIQEKTLGKENKEYASSCNNLAILYNMKGLYYEAEQLYIEAKNIRANVLGKEHYLYAFSCNNLAILYASQGLYQKAELLFIEGLGSIVGKNNMRYAAFCENLASVYYEQKFYDKAEKSHINAKNIKENIVGNKHPNYASSCENLAQVYHKLNLYDKAENLFLEAKKIRENSLGKQNDGYATSCDNLGTLYYSKGSYNKAEALFLEAKNIREQTLGKQHPDYAISCLNLARLYRNTNEYKKSKFLYKEALENKKNQITNLFPTLSEVEKQSYFSTIDYFFTDFINFAITYYPQDKSISENLFNQQLFTKGIVFSSTQKMKKQILSSNDSSLINQYEDWKEQKTNYLSLLQTPINKRDSTFDLIKVASQINELERKISKKSELFKNTTQKEYTWRDVQKNLAKNEAVVELIRLKRKDDKSKIEDTVYVALIISKETKNQPEILVIENGTELEKEAFYFYQNNINFQLEDEESYNQYWKPIQDKLNNLSKKGYSKIYFSPDGIYHKINLNTLKNLKRKGFLVEEQNIQLITSSRDLIERKEKGIKNIDLSKNFAAYKTYLLGYPAYNLNGKDTLKVNGEDRSLNGLQRIIGQQTVIPVLEGTKVETNQINSLFKNKTISTTLFQNNEATEENIKALQNPAILHIATHGFFIHQIPEDKVTTIQKAEDRNLLKNPFLRSGLLLAGCQNPQTGQEDGILSAEEAMNLNLERTELVVLSACETGLGDIQNGEGVYGLQRAFRQAGAKTLIMSLWKVSDEATQLLMVTFYEEFLSGKSKREAFKIAQLKLKEKYSEPYYWGAFVMVGE
ncbi:CHAT domain-containing tetratricopeptide repeat protein [Bernardetia sp. ABR2-2B]|uniref:CHAT domain-containing protein n=1 Tax=Bernardetia sp. ABR2-2B TaxID=3127472 RepID=UPI0030D146CB